MQVLLMQLPPTWVGGLNKILGPGDLDMSTFGSQYEG